MLGTRVKAQYSIQNNRECPNSQTLWYSARGGNQNICGLSSERQVKIVTIQKSRELLSLKSNKNIRRPYIKN